MQQSLEPKLYVHRLSQLEAAHLKLENERRSGRWRNEARLARLERQYCKCLDLLWLAQEGMRKRLGGCGHIELTPTMLDPEFWKPVD